MTSIDFFFFALLIVLEYTFGGLLIIVPTAGQSEQSMALAELTVAKNYVHVDWAIRYNEWNENFHHEML